MKRLLFSLLLIMIPFIGSAQTLEKNYYLDRSLTNKTTRKNAGYLETRGSNPDGTTTLEVLDIATKRIIRKENYRGTEPVGNWLAVNGSGKINHLNYDFPVLYANDLCKAADPNFLLLPAPVTNPFIDNESLAYVAPKIQTGEKSINLFVQKNIVYPENAINKDLQGQVMVNLVIAETGAIEQIAVSKGVNILLDKEAVRIFKNLKFSNPPLLEGKSKKLCLQIPVVFKIED